MVSALRSAIAHYRGPTAKDVEILITETNSVSYNPGRQTTGLVNALFLADSVATWLENGITSVNWWTLHNSPFVGNADPSLYGAFDFGDYGLLSRGLPVGNGELEPAAETPFPTYYGLEVLGQFTEHGEALVAASSSASLLSAHAVRAEDGHVNVLLINKDPLNAYRLSVSVKGAQLFGEASLYTYGPTSREVDRTATARTATAPRSTRRCSRTPSRPSTCRRGRRTPPSAAARRRRVPGREKRLGTRCRGRRQN
jgi:hypothetical protein